MSLEERPRVLVAGAVGQKAVTREQPSRVRVGHEHGAARRVQEDRVHGLGAEPDNREHLPPEGNEWRAAQGGEAPAEPLEEPAGEPLKSPRLEPIRPGGADHLGQLGLGERGKALGTEQTARAQRGHRAGGVRPRGVLGQDGSDRHLVGRPGRPPVLRPEPVPERDVEAQQPCLRGIRRRPRNLPPAENS